MRKRRMSVRFGDGLEPPPPTYPQRPIQMTSREAAPLLGISENRLGNGIKNGIYPFGHMIGSRVVILRPELERWVEGRQLTSAKALLDVATAFEDVEKTLTAAAAALRREAG